MRVMRWGLFLMMVPLAACQSTTTTKSAVDEALLACRAAKERGEIKGYRALAECQNAADARFASDGTSDLLAVLHATRLRDGALVDAGKMTVEDAHLDIAKTRAALNEQALSRQAAAMGNQLTQMQAMQSLMPPPVHTQPYIVPVRPTVTTNCTNIGPSLNCTTY